MATDSRGSTRVYRSVKIRVIRGCFLEEIEVDFQVNGETYFLSLAEDEARWLVFVQGAEGARSVPVYVDEAESEDLKVVVEDKERRKIVN
jgi:hypothetical protein